MVVADWLAMGTPRSVLIGAGVVLLVVALLVVRFVQKMVLRLVLLGLMVLLGLGIYVSRDDLAECSRTCSCQLFEQDVGVPFCSERLGTD